MGTVVAMKKNEIAVGAVVRLKSGGPNVTVRTVVTVHGPNGPHGDHTELRVIWYDPDKGFQEITVAAAEVDVVTHISARDKIGGLSS